MPGEYGNKQSVSVYIEKDYVRKVDIIAKRSDKKRSTLIAELIKEGLRTR